MGPGTRQLLAATAVAACTVGACHLLDRRAKKRARRVDFRWSSHVGAPVERTFALWRYFQSSERFLGAPVTRLERGRRIAWATRPDGPVRHAGVATFAPDSAGTRVDVMLTYGIRSNRGSPRWLLRRDWARSLRAELEGLCAVVEGRPSAGASSRRARPG